MILLDTCAIIWDALARSELSKKAIAAIETADKHNALIISDISIWEIAILIKNSDWRLIQVQLIFLICFFTQEIFLCNQFHPKSLSYRLTLAPKSIMIQPIE